MLLPPQYKFEIVVARYKENVSWASNLSSNSTIYDKSGNAVKGSIPLPNIGREAHTYLNHIVSRYETLSERTLFVQGDPFDHTTLSMNEYIFTDQQMATCVDEVRMFDDNHVWNCYGQCWEIEMEDKYMFYDIVSEAPRPKYQFYNYGAQFSVSAKAIQRKSKEHWQKLFDMTCCEEVTMDVKTYSNYEIAVLFEIFWPQIFLDAPERDRLRLMPKTRSFLSL